jgi:hypothetical protein
MIHYHLLTNNPASMVVTQFGGNHERNYLGDALGAGRRSL